MASPTTTLGGASPSGCVFSLALDHIIKNVSWRKHQWLVVAAKSALNLLSSSAYPLPDPTSPHPSPLLGLPTAAAASLHALLLALESASPKVADPALDCVAKLLYHRLLLGDLSAASDDSPTSKLLTAVLSCGALADDPMEPATLSILVAAARCPSIARQQQSWTRRGRSLNAASAPPFLADATTSALSV